MQPTCKPTWLWPSTYVNIIALVTIIITRDQRINDTKHHHMHNKYTPSLIQINDIAWVYCKGCLTTLLGRNLKALQQKFSFINYVTRSDNRIDKLIVSAQNSYLFGQTAQNITNFCFLLNNYHESLRWNLQY